MHDSRGLRNGIAPSGVANMTTALLLSGGMDSVAIAYWKHPRYGITINYGQKPAEGEIRAASAVCKTLDIEHVVINADISALGSGDLAGLPPAGDAPATEWWPYRNQFLLTIAGMKCLSLEAPELMIGALRTDGFHADGTVEFIGHMNELFQLQEGNLEVTAPAIELTAVELVQKSQVPRSVLAWSHSCWAITSARCSTGSTRSAAPRRRIGRAGCGAYRTRSASAGAPRLPACRSR